FLIKLGGGEKIAVIGDGDGGHSAAGGFGDEVGDAAGAVEKTVVGVQVQVNERGSFHAGGHCSLRRGIFHPGKEEKERGGFYTESTESDGKSILLCGICPARNSALRNDGAGAALALVFLFRRAVARGLGGLLRLRGSLGSGGGFRCVRFARGRWHRGSGFGGRLHCRMNGSFCRAFCGRRGCGGSGLVCGAGCGGGRGSLGSVLSERALGVRLDGLGGFFALLLDFG